MELFIWLIDAVIVFMKLPINVLGFTMSLWVVMMWAVLATIAIEVIVYFIKY